MENIGIRQICLWRDQSLFNRLRQNSILIQSPSIITNFNDDAPSLMIGHELYGSATSLSAFFSNIRHLHSVIARISNHMHQRIVQLFADRSVDFGILSSKNQVNLFPLLGCRITNHTIHLLEGRPNRYHSQRHRRLLQFLRNPCHLSDITSQLQRGNLT